MSLWDVRDWQHTAVGVAPDSPLVHPLPAALRATAHTTTHTAAAAATSAAASSAGKTAGSSSKHAASLSHAVRSDSASSALGHSSSAAIAAAAAAAGPPADWIWDGDIVLCATGDLLLIKCLQFSRDGATHSVGLLACEARRLAAAAAQGAQLSCLV